MPVRNLPGFFIRADHPDNIKRGRICIYYKESLPTQIIDQHYLKGALLLEMSCNNKKVIVSAIYRSPIQSTNELDLFLRNFEFFFQLHKQT